MSGPNDLYGKEMLELAEDCSHCGEVENGIKGEAKNPLCGDRMQVSVRVADGIVAEARFNARGCAISKAAGAQMSAMVEGLSVAEALGRAEELKQAVDRNGPDNTREEFSLFRALRSVPSRKRCATLAWEALEKAIR
ncbi:MAG: iron-sulfur cluster assembly scaffold protein [Myxococcota bacterium]